MSFTTGFVTVDHAFDGGTGTILAGTGIVVGNGFEMTTIFARITVGHLTTVAGTFGVSGFPITAGGGLTRGFR
jgi:hypothetical protein